MIQNKGEQRNAAEVYRFQQETAERIAEQFAEHKRHQSIKDFSLGLVALALFTYGLFLLYVCFA